ncbi:uncharacterized protein RHIMIDRAFT_235736 [Rhizopus microsporus ATCC 52813]|uniref:Uncharacterized protein n=1 Tax=Rhizopus microsporus ATCC 52813 TaxID=1340429 RepID=A0A2G4T1T2_RHIZD|nr:uncharacterized protein RHIMIDRAFT_235736 [Rhizopus microsporus ATCC 52813]PHZ14980.1 hypothetical protein RHIMIDRAFT_235736 [Rhizopus microsporus ATCC 52813]
MSLHFWGENLNCVKKIVGRAFHNCRCLHSGLERGYARGNYSKHSVDCIGPTFVLISWLVVIVCEGVACQSPVCVQFTAFMLAANRKELPCIDTKILHHAFHVSLDFTPEFLTGRDSQPLENFTW